MEVINEFFWALLMMLVLLLHGSWHSNGCWEHERNALLQLKAQLNYSHDYYSFSSYYYRYDYYSFSPNYYSDDVECCNWRRVRCSATTGHVTQLFLHNIRHWDSSRDWHLNASLFLPFQQLKRLDLSTNNIAGCIKNEGFERLSTLENLEFLRLSYNNFSTNILSSLSHLSSLKYLYLYENEMKGRIDIQELNNLTNLKVLDIWGNEIEGFKSLHGGEKLLNMSNLEDLDLSDNHFGIDILPFLKGLSSLKTLWIGYNLLKGPFNLKELDTISNLKELDLSGNNITKFVSSRGMKSLRNFSTLYLNDITIKGRSMLLESLGALTHLKILHLSWSNFEGTLFNKGSYVTNVKELYLDGSSVDENFLQSLEALSSLKLLSLVQLNCTLPIQGLTRLKNLEHLYLNESVINGNFLQIIGVLSSLKTLSMWGCELNNTMFMNQGLCELKYVQSLDISYNQLSGSLPLCLANLTSLQQLDLSENHFIGNISLSPLRSLTSLEYLALSNNLFQIPISLSPFFNNSKLKHLGSRGNEIFVETNHQYLNPRFQLEWLDLSSGGYCEAFPKFLHHQHNLQFVDLSHIQMSDVFPYWLIKNNTKLATLYLVNNSLSGPLQLPLHSHMNLSILDISDNCFNGSIPVEIGTYLPRLVYLYMRGNGFKGSIPNSFGNMSLLRMLDLSNNRLSGSISNLTMGCVSLDKLILSDNSFTGSIPNSLSNCNNLRELDVSHNNLSGKIPIWMRNMSSLQILDLSQNYISGSLPSNFCPLGIIEVHLSKNRLQGLLMDSFYNCLSLLVLDLGHNNLIGHIPNWIGEIPLGYVLLSYNHFEGEIPFQLCKLDSLHLIDLSHNNLSGHIPYCLRSRNDDWLAPISSVQPEQPVEFTTKNNFYFYQPRILRYFSGIDLSCNSLTGEIPPEIGNLSMIKVLNLSHNKLVGPIPPTFSNLKQIESLDLSYNNLDAKIPQLTQLYSLAVFSVAHNNLSGKTPERVAQFATFEQSSYEGNPFLCGPPLPKSCYNTSPSPPRTSTGEKEDNGFMDLGVFYASFVVSYIMVLVGMAAILYINPYWRGRWFYFIEISLTNCYYFVVDNTPLFSKFRVSHN
ncbi:hypothetical protein P3X46_031648 [Hevea brasiliensis]|uniref:Leucine-rich repeat-containing N-terminal plant-type domain-containing protein n=1 Tax=Hevea brasiliensis TaxID=3981 RepID=A0ABQ9KKZ8_HEVBR|nr:cuscuta receptor 1 [Hevea brasiliensis]KAJ9141068.1 hypothetical protein P3X46_031648 [Hevea brasiliensis]